MSRPTGSKNKPKAEVPVFTQPPLPPPIAHTSIQNTHKSILHSENPLFYDAIFGIRCLRKGNFRGLWELTKLDISGNRKMVITDANSKQMIINLLVREARKISPVM